MARTRGFLTTHRIAALGVLLALAIAMMVLTAGTAIAATSFVGAGAVVWNSAASPSSVSITMAAPSGAVGDLLLCQVNFRGGSNATPAAFAGWTLLTRTDRTTEDGQAIYYRVATTTTEGPYTWTYNMTGGATRRAAGNILRYGGVDTSTPPVFTTSSGSGTSLSASGTATTVASTRIVALFGIYSEGTISNPTDMTSRNVFAVTPGNNGPGIRVSDQEIAAAGPTGNKTATSTLTGGWVAHLVSLKPKVTNITVTATGVNKTYDGTAAATVVLASTPAINPLDNVTITYSSATFDNKNAGPGKAINVTGIALSGPDMGKYNLLNSTASTTGTIFQRAITVTAVTDTKDYDGTNVSTVPPSLTSGTLAVGDTGTWTQTFDTAAAATGKTLTPAGTVKDLLGLGVDVTANYAITFTPVTTGVIDPATVTVTADDKTKTYGEADPALTFVAAGFIGIDTWVTEPTGAIADPHVNVGDYAITFSGGDAGTNYDVTYVDGTLSITQAPITVTAVTDTKTYDGTTGSVGVPTSDPLAAGDTGTWTQTFDTAAAGTGKTLTPAGTVKDAGDVDVTANYDITFAPVTTGEITPKELTGAFTADDKPYDGNTDATVATRSLIGVVLGDDVTLDGGTAQFDTSGVGTGKTVTLLGATLGGADLGNYTLSVAPIDTTAAITPKELTGAFTADDKPYDGNTDATVATRSLIGVVLGDDVTLDGGTAQFDTSGVGTGKTVTLLGATLGGADLGNYTLSVAPIDTTAAITPKELTGAFTADDKPYDGNTDATVATRSLIGVVLGDDVTLDGGTAQFDTSGVGTGKTVTLLGATLGGADLGNYTLSVAPIDTTAAITPKELTGAFTADDKPYDGNTDATVATRSLIGVVLGDDVTLDGGTAQFDTSGVGTGKTVTLLGATLGGADLGNYTLSVAPIDTTAAITPKELTGAFTADDKPYDGNTDATVATRSLIGVVLGDDVTLDGGTAQFDTSGVGTGKTVTLLGATLGGADLGNYTLSVAPIDTTAAITPKELTGAFTADDKPYDGNTDATVATRSLIGVVLGDDVTLDGGTAQFDTSGVGTGKTVTLLGATLGGADLGNYTLSVAPITDTADITPLAITVTAGTDTKTYDGTTGSVGVPTSDPLAAGDTGTWTQTFDDAAVGTGKTLTPAGTVKNLADADVTANYDITFTPVTTGEITRATVTVTADDKTKTYGEADPALTFVAAGFIGTDTWVTEPTGAIADPHVNVGDYAITFSGGDAGTNYDVTYVDGTLSITQAPITVTAVTDTKTYDGTTGSVGVPTITSGALAAGDTGTWTQTFDTANVATGKTLTPAGTVKDAGDVDVTANYDITFTPDTTGEITARAITVTAVTDTKTYDGTTSSVGVPTITSGALAAGDTGTWTQTFDTAAAGTGKTLTPAGTVKDAGDVDVTANYDITFTPDTTGEITARAITVTAVTDTKTYDGTTGSVGVPTITSGALDPGDTGTWTQTFDDANADSGKTLTPAGTVKDAADVDVTANYDITFAPDTTGVITTKAITVTAGTDTKTYDGTTGSAGVPTSDPLAAGDTGTWTQTFDTANVGTGKTLTPAGTVKNLADADVTANYDITFTPVTTGEITRATVTVTADDKTKTYGEADPALTFVAAGFIGIDTWVTEPTGAIADPHVNVGDYAITFSGGDAGTNYDVTYVDGTLSITQAPITVTAVTDTKTYDGTTGSVGVPTITSGALAAGDTGTWTQTFDTANVATGKTLTPAGTVKDAGDVDVTANYDITFTPDTTGEITARAITVTAVTDTKTYDGTTSSVGVPTITSGALAAGDTGTWTQTFDTAAAGTGKTLTPAGTVKDAGDVDVTANYDITFTPDTTGEITARAITVTAVTDTKTYDGTTGSVGVPTITSGALDPGDTGTWTQTFDDANADSGKTLTPAGTVKDAADVDVTANYDITFASDTTGVITTKAITVTAGTDTKTYDGTTGSAGVPTSDPLAAGDTGTWTQTFDDANVGTGKTLTPAGTVKNLADADVTANYDITFTPVTTGEITRATVTVTADDKTRTYGEADPALTFVAAGFIGTDTWVTEPTGAIADPHVNVGDYAITFSGGDAGTNYDVTYVDGTLSITQAPITVTAVTDTKTYDGTTGSVGVPTITSGALAAGDTGTWTQTFDTANVATGKTLTPAGTVKDAGDVDVTANYDITFTPDTTGVITRATVTVTADDKTKTYGGADPALTFTSTGFAGDDTWFTQPTGTIADPHVNVGDYAITFSGGDAGSNYDVSFVDGTLTITQAPITVTAVTDTKTYDGTTSSAGIPNLTGALAAGDTGTWTQTFDTAAVGTGKTLTPAGTVKNPANADMTANYLITFTSVNTGVINAAPVNRILKFVTDGTVGAFTSEAMQIVVSGGDSDPVTATAPASHDFVNWTGTGSFETTTANPLTVTNVTADATITAHFAIKTFEIVPTAGAHGTITPSTTQTVDYGADKTFTFTPETGYHVATLTVDASAVATTATSYTFSNVREGHTIGVTFAADTPATTYTLNYTAGTGGSIDGSATQVVTEGSDGATVTAVPDTGYRFVKWSDDSTSAVRQDTAVTANLDVTATFEAVAPTTFEIVPTAGAHGTITPATTQTVDAGANATFTFTPDTGYHVATLTVDASAVATTATSYTFTAVAADHTIDVTFAKDDAVLMPVWRFRNKKLAATYLWTASDAERTNIEATMGDTWVNEGVAFEINTANPLNKDPLWRFLKTTTWTYFFTATEAEKDNTIANLSSMWGYEGAAFSISLTPQAETIWRFRNASTNTFLFTGDVEKALVLANNPEFALEGPAFWIAP